MPSLQSAIGSLAAPEGFKGFWFFWVPSKGSFKGVSLGFKGVVLFKGFAAYEGFMGFRGFRVPFKGVL